MKALFATLMLAGALSFTAGAQESRPRGDQQREKMTAEQRAEKQTDRMVKALKLSEAQRKTVYEANLKAAREMDPVIQQLKESRMKAKAIREEKDASLKQTLTADQYQQFEELRQEGRQRRMERRKGFGQQDQPGSGNPDIRTDAPTK